MAAINRLCHRALWLDHGSSRMDSSAEAVVSQYLTDGTSQSGQCVWEDGTANAGVTEIRLRAIRIKNSRGTITGVLDARKPFWLEIEYQILENLPSCRIGIRITTVDGTTVFTTFDADQEEYGGRREEGLFVSKCEIPGYLLSPGRYVLTAIAGIRGIKNLALLENVLSFDIEDTQASAYHLSDKRHGIIRPKLTWKQDAL